jgi:hypothetical protein
MILNRIYIIPDLSRLPIFLQRRAGEKATQLRQRAMCKPKTSTLFSNSFYRCRWNAEAQRVPK